jgi:predicted amidohydrolase
MKAGFFQFRPLFGQPQKNLKKVVETLRAVAADLIVLPELAFSGYYFANKSEASAHAEVPSQSGIVEALKALCKSRDFFIVTGFTEKAADKVFNSALLIGPQGLIHTYRKIHLFNTEKDCFDPGDTPLSVQEVREALVGMMVCFDWFFPEVSRSLALQGAHLIAHPSNLVLNFCQQSMVTRCLENGVFAITANRFGADNRPHGSLRFTGRSQITAPKGRIVHRAHSQRDALFIADLDLSIAQDKHPTPRNHLLNDRRPAYYEKLFRASTTLLQ